MYQRLEVLQAVHHLAAAPEPLRRTSLQEPPQAEACPQEADPEQPEQTEHLPVQLRQGILLL